MGGQFENHLGAVDYCVIAGTFMFSLGIGIYYAIKGRKVDNSEELLVGGRKMGAIPVAASILVSYLSAITILGYPAEVYSYGSQVYVMTLVGVITTPLSIYVFVKVMYDLKLTSAYKYLELRYNSVVLRWLGSIIFIVQLLFMSGVVLYAPAIAMETLMGVPMWKSVIGIGICGTIYTSIGGIKAVVWTDVFQFLMIFTGMTAIVIKGAISSGGISEAFRRNYENGRLELFKFNFDPFERHNTINIILGSGFTGMFYVVHQPVVQRYCSLPTFKDAVKSIVWSFIFGLSTVTVVIMTGLAIYATYSDCDPVSWGLIAKSDQIVPFFVTEELSFIPGMMGLFAAVIFSAVLSTISSTLNSLAAVTWEDFLSRISFFSKMTDFSQATTYKVLSITYGVICVSLAFLAQHFGGIFQAAITIIGTVSGVMGTVFLMGVFVPFCNKYGAVSGILSGAVIMSMMGAKAILLQKTHAFQHKLPVSIEGCESKWDFNASGTVPWEMEDTPLDQQLHWPEKIFTLSYILYSFLGAMITFIVGVSVSLCTMRFEKTEVDPMFLHPLLRRQETSKEKKASKV